MLRRLPWVLIAIVVALLFLLGLLAVWLLQEKADQDSPSNTNGTSLLNEREQKTCGLPSADTVAAQETIVVSGVGFEPAEVAIKVGQTVRWVNNGSSNHRMAVDPHPLHNDCIGLDSKELLPESSFGFTFTKPGEWLYHDDNHLSNQGKIVVTE